MHTSFFNQFFIRFSLKNDRPDIQNHYFGIGFCSILLFSQVFPSSSIFFQCWSQLGTISDFKIYQHLSQHGFKHASKNALIFSHVFCWFWLRFGTQLESNLATFSSKFGRRAQGFSFSCSDRYFCSFYALSWSDFGPILVRFCSWRRLQDAPRRSQDGSRRP